MSGKGLRNQPPDGRLGARSASVTGSNTPPSDCFGANRTAKKRENHLARNLRQSLNEGCEVDMVIQNLHKRVNHHALFAYLLSSALITIGRLVLAISFYIIVITR